MTNQLTHTDTAITTTTRLPSRIATSTSDEQPKQPRRARGGLILLVGGAAVAAVIGFAATANDPGEPARPTVQQRSAGRIIQNEIDAALARRNSDADPSDQRSAAVIIQDEIDAALAEHNGEFDEQRSAARIIQDEIDAALARRSSVADSSDQ